jgi:uncharacterized membrane protein HdeD (DUF308 family)
MDEERNRISMLAQGAAGQVSGRLGHLWWFFLLRGIFAAILGIVALVWPSASLAILTALVGIFFVADGAAGLWAALRNRALDENLLQPILGVAIGAVLLFWPGVTVRLVLVILGIWALAFGVSQMLEARRIIPDESKERGSVVTVGGIAAVLGAILILWPGTGVIAVSWVIAIAAFIVAALLIFLALRTKRLNDRLDQVRAKRG